MPTWDPQTYSRYGAERSRPFADLVGAVGARTPRRVVDLGCGRGDLTATLARRWPGAEVVGVDASAPMLVDAAQQVTADLAGRLRFVQADVADWQPDDGQPVDVVVTNATLQWVPGHLDLLHRWAAQLPDGGWLALQVPGNLAAPSHALMREVAAEPPFAGALTGVLRADPVAEPGDYATLMAEAGLAVDAWETTYTHVLDPAGEHGDDAVLAWVQGTGLRPVLQALDGDPALRDAYLARYSTRLRAAYPRRPWGTPLAFRRVFAVGHRPGAVGERPLVTGVHHVQLSCPAGSEDALRGFWAGVLGMTELAKPPLLAARGGAWFRSGTAEVHCGVELGFTPALKAHPGIAVDDVDAAAARVAAAGLPVTWDDAVPGLRRFHTVDPVGNRVELQQQR